MRFLTFEAISDKIRCKFFWKERTIWRQWNICWLSSLFSGSLHNRLFPPGKNICGESDQKDLDLLKNLDSETTMKYISYQELFPDSDDNTELSDDIKEVFSSSSRILITKYWIYPLTRIRKLLLHTCGLPLWIPRRLRKISLPRALKMKS